MDKPEGKQNYWFELAQPLICEGCGRSIWRKGMYHALTAQTGPGPVTWTKVEAPKRRAQRVEVRTSVSVMGAVCSCGRDWSLRILWVPRYFGTIKPVSQLGYQIWSSETPAQALDRVLAARMGLTEEKPPERKYNPITQEQAESARQHIAAIREAMKQ